MGIEPTTFSLGRLFDPFIIKYLNMFVAFMSHSSNDRQFRCRKLGLLVRFARKRVSVGIEGQGNARMAHHGLNLLRLESLVDQPVRIEVPEGVISYNHSFRKAQAVVGLVDRSQR